MKQITLIKKQCGHYGIVREEYKQEIINCSQCENKINRATVQITHKKIIREAEFPQLNTFKQIQTTIKKILRA